MIDSLSSDDNYKTYQEISIDKFKLTVDSIFVNEFTHGTERLCEKKDFEEHVRHCDENIEKLADLMKNLTDINYLKLSCNNELNNTLREENVQFFTSSLIICGENIALKAWNSEKIVNNCRNILQNILNIFDCQNVSELIMKRINKKKFVNYILETLNPKLLSSTWKNYPAAVVCYKWILENIKQPELSSLLSLVVPTSLLLVDDFVVENRISGIECLNHIIENSMIADLQFCGYGNVIFSALEPILRVREPDLIKVLIPCLMNLTMKLKIDFKSEEKNQWSKLDGILEIIFENMEMEQLISLRSAYVNYLELIIKTSGFGIIRWSKRVLRIFREYLEVAVKSNDEKTVNCCLKAIEKYMELSGIVDFLCSKSIFFILLLGLYHKMYNCKNDTQSESMTIIIKCIKIVTDKLLENEKVLLKDDFSKKFQNSNSFNNFYVDCKKYINFL